MFRRILRPQLVQMLHPQLVPILRPQLVQILRPQLLQILRPAATTKILASSSKSLPSPRFANVEQKWRERDGIPSQYQLIYKAPMDKLMNFATTYLTLTTSTVGCFTVYCAMFQFNKYHPNDPVVLGHDIVIANSATECLTYLGAFIFFNILLKVLLSQYVIRIYQHGDQYIAIYRGHIHNMFEKNHFHLGQFDKRYPAFAVPWADSRYIIGGKKSILLENYFRTPEHLNYLIYKSKDRVYEDSS